MAKWTTYDKLQALLQENDTLLVYDESDNSVKQLPFKRVLESLLQMLPASDADAGFISAADKAKLDGIADGANKTTLSSSTSSASTTTAATSAAVKAAYDKAVSAASAAATAGSNAATAYNLANNANNAANAAQATASADSGWYSCWGDFMKVRKRNGIVTCIGYAQNGTGGLVLTPNVSRDISTAPVGYRPNVVIHFTGSSLDGKCLIHGRIGTDGILSLITPGNINGYWSYSFSYPV